MATFTDWMRLGEAGMTSIATLGAALLDCYLHHRPPNGGIGCACNPSGHPHCAEAPKCP
jgi:hypothetical protein